MFPIKCLDMLVRIATPTDLAWWTFPAALGIFVPLRTQANKKVCISHPDPKHIQSVFLTT